MTRFVRVPAACSTGPLDDGVSRRVAVPGGVRASCSTKSPVHAPTVMVLRGLRLPRSSTSRTSPFVSLRSTLPPQAGEDDLGASRSTASSLLRFEHWADCPPALTMQRVYDEISSTGLNRCEQRRGGARASGPHRRKCLTGIRKYAPGGARSNLLAVWFAAGYGEALSPISSFRTREARCSRVTKLLAGARPAPIPPPWLAGRFGGRG
jgi:hypothetical protein